MDCLFIHPNNSNLYQNLAKSYSAIEPPTWALLLAGGLEKEFGVGILDCEAEHLTNEVSLQRVIDANPRIVCFVVYGQNPNSGTTNMSGAIKLAKLIKENTNIKVAFIGTYPSALPSETLSYKCIDFVMPGDGLYALQDLLRSNLKDNLSQIKGLGWKDHFGLVQLNQAGHIVLTENLDQDLPRYAWNLLPYKEKPLDLYRSHFWHTNYNHEKRTPFAAIYSSLGCAMKCEFCCINMISKNDLTDNPADQYNKMRFWSPEHMIGVIGELVEKYGVETLRICDELFFFNKKYYKPLIDKIIERGYKINTWTYSRVDTVKEDMLEEFKKAGVNWLGLGIEAASQTIRQEITKGKFKDVDIREVCKKIEDAGINVGANYIFGFPNEKVEDLQATLDLALELNTAFANFYTATALPGSPLYFKAKENGWKLPTDFAGYGFLAKEFQPLPTNYLSGAEVLKFRDDAWHTYFENPQFLSKIESKFGLEIRQNIEKQSKIKLERLHI